MNFHEAGAWKTVRELSVIILYSDSTLMLTRFNADYGSYRVDYRQYMCSVGHGHMHGMLSHMTRRDVNHESFIPNQQLSLDLPLGTERAPSREYKAYLFVLTGLVVLLDQKWTTPDERSNTNGFNPG